MKQCSLCGEAGKLINAHIIPEAFFREMRDDKSMPILISNTPNTFRKSSPIGVYDQGILCNKCETKFSLVDDYGIDIFLKRLNEIYVPIKKGGQITAYQVENVNQEFLLRFLVAVLWRASVSTHPFYNRVKLGSLENIAKESILNPQKPVPKQFSAILSRWVFDERSYYVTKGIMDPFPEKYADVNVYRFYFGEIIAYIKADSRPFPASLQSLALLEQSNLFFIAREADRSKDLPIMINTVQEAHANYEKQRKSHQNKNA